jgi:hypothetical protein
MYNTYSFSTETMVVWMWLNVMLNIHCLTRYIWKSVIYLVLIMTASLLKPLYQYIQYNWWTMIYLQYCIHTETSISTSHVFYIRYVINLPKCQKTPFNFETLTSGPTTIHNFTIFRDIIITPKLQPWFLAMFCLASSSWNTTMYNVYHEIW